MREQKEILIQDLGDSEEIEKYIKCHIYRRDIVFGSPLYFAPYFTKKSNEKEGISYLSKIIGILSLSPAEIDNYNDELSKFSSEQEIIKNWKSAIKKMRKKQKTR